MADPPGPYPEGHTGEHLAHEFLAATAEAVPFFGGFLSRIATEFWVTDLEQRRTEWFHEVSATLDHHSQRIDGLEERLGSSQFLTLFMKAARAVQETHEPEVRQALRNAVVNAALHNEDEEWQHIFVELAARLRPAHLRLLIFYQNPAAHISQAALDQIKATTGKRLVMATDSAQTVFDDWTPAYFAQIHNDLLNEGLLDSIELKTIAKEREPKTSRKGDRFHAFITQPDDS